MASKKKKKEPAAKSAAAEKSKAPVGKTSGVGVGGTWVQVFERNEQCDEEDRRTDEQISEFMKSEFPDLDSASFDRVEIARGKYNRGGFHKKDKGRRVVRPKIHSNQHGDQVGQGGGGRHNPRSSGGSPIKDRVVSRQKDFKSHKK